MHTNPSPNDHSSEESNITVEIHENYLIEVTVSGLMICLKTT